MQGAAPSRGEERQPAYLFQWADSDLFGVTTQRSGGNLPEPENIGSWFFVREFALGVQDPVPAPIDPEPILRGIRARGYFVWNLQHSIPFGTSQ